PQTNAAIASRLTRVWAPAPDGGAAGFQTAPPGGAMRSGRPAAGSGTARSRSMWVMSKTGSDGARLVAGARAAGEVAEAPAAATAPAGLVMNRPARSTDHDRLARRDLRRAMGARRAHLAWRSDRRPGTRRIQEIPTPSGTRAGCPCHSSTREYEEDGQQY